MENRFLCRGKRTDTGEWVIGNRIDSPDGHVAISETSGEWKLYECIPSTICRCTGLKDKNSKLIWENDILMCHGNSEDLVKAVFGEFNVINAETLEVIDHVIGWHYEVVPTDVLSKCEPFCFPMPLTEEYVKTCKMKVVDNPELLEVQPCPTAYDVDKVVEQLGKLKKAEQGRPDDCDEDGCGDGEQIYDDGRSQGRYEAFSKAIEIVKGGGADA